MSHLAILACFSLALAGCAARTPVPAAPPPGTAAAPEDTDRLFGERLNAGDLDGLVALYEGGATYVRPDGSPATGRAAIRAELAAVLAAKPAIEMNVVAVHRGGLNVALLYNDWRATLTGTDGTRQPLRGCAIEVVRRQPDGRWLFVIDDPTGRPCDAPLPAAQ